MPYILSKERPDLDALLVPTADKIETLGQLNYVVTRIALRFFMNHGFNYSTIAGVIGTLFLVPLEMLRRIVNQYEDRKIDQNGDVREYIELQGKDYR